MMAKRIIRGIQRRVSGEATSSSSEGQWLLSNSFSIQSPVPDSDDDESSTESGSCDSEIEEFKEKPLTKKWIDYRLQFVYYLDGSIFQKYWDMLDLILNLIFCISYIVLTWLSIGERGADKNTPAPPPPPFLFQMIDLGLAFLLLVQWIPHVVFTLFPYTELQSSWSISTFLSTLSV